MLALGSSSFNITGFRIEDEPVDPICHTMVGLALSKSGLDRWAPRATAVLVVAANAPDVDIVATFFGQNLAWRRGVTHGVPALLIWPVLLAVVTMMIDRGQRVPDRGRARFGPLVAIAAIGVVTHPILDFLNSYGLRWLMPIQGQWFYGDSLFIVDPWLYLLLGLGLWLTRRNRRAGDATDQEASEPGRAAKGQLQSDGPDDHHHPGGCNGSRIRGHAGGGGWDSRA